LRESHSHKWVEEVIATIPKDRLLIFEVKEGWGPLCKFQGLSEPDVSFPRSNDIAQMKARNKMLTIVSRSIGYGMPFSLSAGIAYFCKGL
jgi:hypothetical protein